MRRFVICLVVFSAFPLSSVAQEKSLADRLLPVIKSHKGKIAVAVKHLDSSESFLHDADEALPTASLIKFAIMLEVYQQVLEGKVKLSDLITLRDADKVPGAGILTYHFSEPATFPLRDAVRLMMVYSDNTATNLVLDKVGIRNVNGRMEAWGCPNTRVNAKVFLGSKTSVDPERTKKFGLGSTTARETITLLEKLHREEFVSPKSCKEMLEHMKKCDDKDKLKRFLPAGVVVAHKTGSVSDVKTDAGILYLKSGPVAVCVLTAQNEDKRYAPDNAASITIGRIGQEIHAHFEKKK